MKIKITFSKKIHKQRVIKNTNLFLLITLFTLWQLPNLNLVIKFPRLPTNVISPARVAILLTSYCTPHRYNTIYQRRFDWWLTTYPHVYIVDSAGYLRISEKVCSFVQQEPKGDLSYCETLSLRHAFDYFDFSQFDMVIKITGKYIVPGFQSLTIPSSCKILLQQRRGNLWQNSEIVGMAPQAFKKWVNTDPPMRGFERALFWQAVMGSAGFRLQKIDITPEWRIPRANGTVLQWL